MNPGIRQSFEKLERQKEALLAEVSTWSAARLKFRPEPAGWSTVNVFDHLVKVEQGFVANVRKNLPDGSPVALKERVTGILVTGFMLSPVRVKVPASAAAVLPRGADPATVTQHWDEARVEIAGLVSRLSPEQLRRGLFRHPISGWMTMPRALTFLSAHLRHHGYQLTRLERASRGI